ncbi:MAG: erythromycin esterase family protein [Myxococcales bacterium]|nr:MAG: erythromycin esterase family protein [Myxococcales bacterium]
MIALGEAHHTSGGFYQAKSALIKYLILKKNFRAVAFESNWISAQSINDYILGKTNDAKTALLTGGYRVWFDESILQLIIWIRNYNDSHPNEKVVFFGFDMQDPASAESYLNTNSNLLKKAAEITVSSYQKRKKCWETQITADNSEPEICMTIRDEAMADIFMFLKTIYAPNKKTIIWAANGHIQKHGDIFKPMGYFLSKKLGLSYASVLLVASRYDTYQNWVNPVAAQLEAPKESLEEWAETFGYDSLFIDMKKLNPALFGMSEEQFVAHGPLNYVDGAIYLKTSEAMTLVD